MGSSTATPERQGRVRRDALSPWALAGAWLLPTAFFASLGPWLADRYGAEGTYFGHGPLVILAVLGWVFLLVRSEKLGTSNGGMLGVPLAIVAAALLYLLRTWDAGFLGAMGWWIAIGALLLAIGGPALLRGFVGPYILLLFAVPWPLAVIESLSVPLKSWAMELGLAIAPGSARRLGESAHIQLSDGGLLLVGEVCSGLRSLVSLLAAGYGMAALTRGGWVRKVAVFGLSAPVAVLANGVRIAVLIAVGEVSGVESAGAGTLAHDGSGILIFVVALGLLGGASALLGTRELRVDVRREPKGTPSMAVPALCVGILALGFFPGAAPPAPLRTRAADLVPRTLVVPGGPTLPSREIELAPSVARLLRPQEILNRTYGDHGEFHLCLVHGRGPKTRLHAPEICLRGGGFEVTRRSEVPLPDPFPGAPDSVNELVLERSKEKTLLWYWYRSNGTSTPSYVRFWLGALLGAGRSQVLVWVSVRLDAEGVSRGRARLRWLLLQLGPGMGKFLSET